MNITTGAETRRIISKMPKFSANQVYMSGGMLTPFPQVEGTNKGYDENKWARRLPRRLIPRFSWPLEKEVEMKKISVFYAMQLQCQKKVI